MFVSLYILISIHSPIHAWPRVYKTFFLLNSAQHETCSANKSQITYNRKFYLEEEEEFFYNKYENANCHWHFRIY